MPPSPRLESRTPTPSQAVPQSIDDWSLLFGAVTDRLRRYALELPAPDGQVLQPPLALPLRQGVLDCVAALEQLRAMVAGTLERSSQRERELRDALDQLARLGAELEGSRIGERRARHLALHDDLTALPNRVLFRDRLGQALLRASSQRPSLAVLYLDLDEFKQVNDRQGHGAGDQVLRIVAARLRGALRTDDLVSRLGGDEFACLLLGPMSRDRLSHMVHKLLDGIGEPVQIDAACFTVRPSIGIAVYPGDGASADELLGHADAAMYRAKRLRSGYAFFDGAIDV